MRKLELHWKILIGMFLGVLFAFIMVNFSGGPEFVSDFIKPFGTIFINALKLIAVPLILASLIKGISDLKDISKLSKMGGRTIGIYILTTVIAVTIGLGIVNIIKPGNSISEATRLELVENYSGDANEKIMAAAKQQESGPLQALVDLVPSNIFKAASDNGNMLQVIFFAIFFGVVLVNLNENHAKPVRNLMEGLNELFVAMVNVIIKTMPFFVFALMAGSLVEAAGENMTKLKEQLLFLGHYSWVVVLALFLVAFVFYPLLIHLFVKRLSIMQFLKGISKAQLTAFSTSSSMATLPVTMECVHDNLKVPKPISSFVLPIGATVNMDGTSLYQAIAVVAMAQFHMIDLSFAQQMIIVLTATLASIGAAAVPSAGLVLMIVVLESVGLNPAWIAIILPVDRILDMSRTVVNVTGDATVSTIIAASEETSEKE